MALACACAPARTEVPRQGSRSAITGGDPEAGYLAVFALAYEGQGACSGTCITPRVGTTAAHCIAGDPASAFSGLFGADEQSPVTTIPVTAVAEAPDGGDFALVAFADACPATIPANRTPLEGHVGEAVVMVGFGVTTEDAGDAGVKRSGVATLFSVDPAEVPGMEAGELATSNDPDGTCNGDSGGPTFMTFGGVEHMVGVTSRGSVDGQGREYPCGEGRSIAVRADVYGAFIDEFVAAHDPQPGDPEPQDPQPGDPEPQDPQPGDPDEPPPPEVADGGCQVGGRASGAGSALVLLVAIALFRRRTAVLCLCAALACASPDRDEDPAPTPTPDPGGGGGDPGGGGGGSGGGDEPGGGSSTGDPTGSDACDAAWECAEGCAETNMCADTDDACWQACEQMCGLETACANEPEPADPAACDAAWDCSDQCGETNMCGEDDACWQMCDEMCNLETACAPA